MSSKLKKKKSKKIRSQYKYPNLYPQVNLKTRQDKIDYDYLNQLNDEEKAWLNKFTGEYVNAGVVQNDEKRLEKQLHNTKTLAKSCTDKNNAANRDILTRSKAAGGLLYLEDLKNEVAKLESEVEDLDETTDDSDNKSQSSD